jgi:tetratricopeptide (TPR) repeat protein
MALRILLLAALAAASWRVTGRLVALEIGTDAAGVAELERALRWDPENADLALRLGQLYRDSPGLFDLRKAGRYLEQAVTISPYSWRAHWELAQLDELTGRPADAERELRQAIALNPRDPTYQWRLANFYLRQGAPAKLLPPLKAALALDRSLWQPGFALLLKLGTPLEQIDRVWSAEREARLFLLRSLSREQQRFPRQRMLEFVTSGWRSLSAQPPTPTLEEAAFVPAYLLDSGASAAAKATWVDLAVLNGLADPAFARGENLVWNGGFELPLSPGPFDWRVVAQGGAAVSVAAGEGVYDSAALRVDFDGSDNLELTTPSQTVVVRSQATYELTFRARAEDLTTDRGIFVEVYDPINHRSLIQTEETLATTPWRHGFASFTTPPGVERVELRLRRLASQQIDSEISGSFWLDEVAVAGIDQATVAGAAGETEADRAPRARRLS